MIEFLSHGFAQRAAAAGALLGVLCALLSVHVVLRRLAFIGVGISHAAFGGVALGVLLGINPLGTAVVFSLGVAFGIGSLTRRLQLHGDTAVGIFFSTAMALGVVFIGLSRSYNVDLFGYLFGSILAVTSRDLAAAAAVGLPVGAFLLIYRKELYLISFDEELARVAGVPVQGLNYAFLAAVALTIVLSIKLLGIILVSALIVIPAAAAMQLTFRYSRLMLLAVLQGLTAVAGGLALSYALDLASGASIVLVSAFLFALSALFGGLRRGGE